MKKSVGYYIKSVSDNAKRELANKEIYEAFVKEYENRNDKIKVVSYNIENKEKNTKIDVKFKEKNNIIRKVATGNGPIDATIKILKEMGHNFDFKDFIQQSTQNNKEKSEAITYINIEKDGKNVWAVGKNSDVIKSSLLGIVSAVNRLEK